MKIQDPTRFAPTADAAALEDKKAQYAAWRDRLKQKEPAQEEVIDLAVQEAQAPSIWTRESLLSYDWSA
jgi:hypothetical protein